MNEKLLTWKEFKQTFGTHTTTNFDLLRWAKYLKIKPFYYVMRDEIKELPDPKTNIIYAITNIHTSKERGVHHSAIYSGADPSGHSILFFDSYALPPTKEILEKFNHTENRICGDEKEQLQFITKDQQFCGQMALYFLYCVSKGLKYSQILNKIKD